MDGGSQVSNETKEFGDVYVYMLTDRRICQLVFWAFIVFWYYKPADEYYDRNLLSSSRVRYEIGCV